MTEATQAIARLRELLEAATPGEWLARYDDRITRSDDTDGTKSIMHVYSGKYQRADRALTVALHNAAPALLACVERLSELLAANIVEYGEPDDGEADESVGWKGDGTPMPFKYGHMQRARAALASLNAALEKGHD